MGKKVKKRASKRLDKILCPSYFIFGTVMLTIGIMALVKGFAPTGGILFFVLVAWFYYDAIKTLLRLRANDYEAPEQEVIDGKVKSN
jgi:hypothetical protein